MPLFSLPCLFEGCTRDDYDADSHKLPVRRRWHECQHPDQPLGPVVTAGMGCGQDCARYRPDESRRAQVMGLVPLRETVVRPSVFREPAFNGSLIRYQGALLLAYRQGPAVRLAELNEHYLPVTDRPLSLLHDRCSLRQEDPRLFVHQGRLCVSFTGVEQDPDVKPTGLRTSVLWAILDHKNDYQPVVTFYPHYEDRMAWEKNWAFFSHGGQLFAVYSIKPHVVLRVVNDHAQKAYETNSPHAWTGGHLRGGAPPVLTGPEYLHFFHGRIGLGVGSIYNTGVYAFEARPPFKITRMTRDPIQWADPETRRGVSASVVFVGGAVPGKDVWTLAYGRHDQEVVVADFDALEVEKRMTEAPYALPDFWCIYCQELPERRHQAEGAFAQAGVRPRWWRGLHGNTWGLMTQKVYTRGDGPITPGHAALCLNHYNLWQHLWESGVEEAVICEDDVLFEPDFKRRVSDMLERLPPDAQFVFLGHTGCCDSKIRQQVTPALALTDVVYGTHCYYVRRSALPVLLERMRECRSHVDLQLWENVLQDRHLTWYAATPELARQGSADGVVPGSLGGSPWPGLPQDLGDLLQIPDRHLGGWCPLEKSRQMAALILREKPRVVVELGVYGGKSLIPQALALRHVHRNGGPAGMVYGVDPWTLEACDEGWEEATADQLDHRKWWLERSDLDGQIKRLSDFISQLDLWPYVRLVGLRSEQVADAFTHPGIDVLHIDGNHAVETALRDVRLYLPRVKPGGFIWLDDTAWLTTQAAVREVHARASLVLDAGNHRLYRRRE